MPIAVVKSPELAMNPEMNEALEAVMTTLNKQEQHVKSVSVLSNFSLDTETALSAGIPVVVQGIVVCLNKEYKFSPEDAAWFHPDVVRGRSVFGLSSPVAKSTLQNLGIKGSNNSVGEYQISTPDEFGCEQVENRLVVDLSARGLMADKYDEWLTSGITAGELDNQWKRMQFGTVSGIKDKARAMRQEMAARIAPNAKLVHSDMSHGILSDIQHVYVANGAVRNTDTVLVKSSTLGGYRMYSVGTSERRFSPSNLGLANTFYAWDNLSSNNCARIVNTCLWPGDLSFNTQAMRPPSIKNIKHVEDALCMTLRDTLKMRQCALSASDNIFDKLSTENVLQLTPTSEQSPNAQAHISAPLNMNHAIMNNLMHNIEEVQAKFGDFQLFNPKYISNGRLHIPREVYAHVV